jgi:pyrroline-5-carboxylate reductase
MVLEGMTAITPNSTITEAHLNYVCRLLESFGQTEIVPENLMDAVTGVSGSSPAFIYMLIEAMADQAVKEGMPRKQAYKFAAQAVLGSAKMVLETGEHPGVLKDAVCSPGGTTIAGVAKLEENGFRHAIMSAIEAAVAKSRG